MLTQPQLKNIEMRGTSGPVGSATLHLLAGIRIFVHKAQPRYELPEWLLPEPYCVPWPKGFKEETDAWALRVCGKRAGLIQGTEVLQTSTGFHMNEATFARLSEFADEIGTLPRTW